MKAQVKVSQSDFLRLQKEGIYTVLKSEGNVHRVRYDFAGVKEFNVEVEAPEVKTYTVEEVADLVASLFEDLDNENFSANHETLNLVAKNISPERAHNLSLVVNALFPEIGITMNLS